MEGATPPGWYTGWLEVKFDCPADQDEDRFAPDVAASNCVLFDEE